MKTRSAAVNPFQTEARSAPFVLDAPKFRTVEMLRMLGPQSRTHIAELITYSPSKITSVVNELIEEGVLEEVGEEASTGGRRARAVDFNPNFGYIAAVTYAPQRVDIALVDFAANIRVRRVIPLPEQSPPQDVLNTICDFLLERLDKLHIPLERIFGFGLVTPAGVDVQTGTLHETAGMPDWSGYQIDSHLREVFPYAVIVLERDVNAIAYGELRRGGRSHRTLMIVKAYETSGVGLVIDGSLYRGATGLAGDIGSLDLSGDDVASYARFIDPEVIVIVGDGSDSEAQFAAMLNRCLLAMSPSAPIVRRIKRSQLGPEAAMIGLILRVAEDVFTLEAR